MVADVLYEGIGLISYEAYLQKAHRGTLRRERKACPGSKALINYELLPDAWKELIVEKYGNPYSTVKHESFIDFIVKDQDAERFYREYVYNENSSLSLERQKEYCINAEILNTVQIVIQNRKARCKALGGRASKVWENISAILNELDRKRFPHTLPTNQRSLQRVFKRYMDNGYMGLIHKNYGNDNSEKINDNAKIWILTRWSNQVERCANINQLFMEYNRIAPDRGWKQLEDPASLKLFLNREDTQPLWWGHRYGELRAKEKYSYQHSTKLPTMRDSLWYSDGTKLNYFYLNAEGKVSTINVYEVMDAYSEVLLGYHIAEKEDYQTQYSAYKMAVQFAGHKPYQLGFDNQGGHKKLENGSFLSKIAHLAIKTQPYNGKSKTIESAFNRFQSQYLKQDWFFTGQNITAKKLESKAQLEFINANKNNLPSLKEIKDRYKQRRDEWNNSLHHVTGLPRLEMYLNSKNEACPKVEMWDMVEIFWILREQPVMYSAYGLTFQEKNEKYTYTVYNANGLPDMDWHGKNIDKKFFIKFDPEDMGMVLLYEKDSAGELRFVTEAKTKVEIARGKQEQTDFDRAYLAGIKKINDEARVQRVAQMETMLQENGVSVSDYGLNQPAILGINSKRKKTKRSKEDFGKLQKQESELIPVLVNKDDEEDINIYDRM